MEPRLKRLADYSKESILSELKRVAEKLGKETLSDEDITKHSRVSTSTIQNKFGSLSKALELTGLKALVHRKVADEEYLREIDRIWSRLGRQPKVKEMKKYGSKYGDNAYLRRFGSWIKACEAYVDWKNKPSVTSERIDNIVQVLEQPVKKSMSRKSVEYGEPIDFLGLRHAPINEQGVVFLFGVLSKTLGFTVEAIRSEYPDCEAKREIRGKKGHWERVSIEFEYRSSNFETHGHNPNECDLIVCWEHDWPNCPLEVISLKKVMEGLTSS